MGDYMDLLLKTLCITSFLAVSNYANANDGLVQLLSSGHFILLGIGLIGLKATRHNAKSKS